MVIDMHVFITFGLCLIVACIMGIVEWVMTKDKERVKYCLFTATAGAIFLLSLTELIFVLHPDLRPVAK